jgi:hypothetical protein
MPPPTGTGNDKHYGPLPRTLDTFIAINQPCTSVGSPAFQTLLKVVRTLENTDADQTSNLR